MRSKSSAAAHVGRIGALAVALGVGAAVTLGHGVAVADTTGSSPSDSSSESASAGDPSASESSASTETSGTEKDATPSSDDDEDAGPTESSDQDDADADLDLGDDEDADEEAATDEDAEEPAEEPATDPEPSVPQSPKAGSSTSAAEEETAVEETVEEVGEDTTDEVIEEPADEVLPTADEPTVVDTPATSETVTDEVAESLPTDEPVVNTAASTARAVPSTAPSLPKTFSGLLAAVGLAPLIANLPAAPAPPPTLWAVLAWARREFERAFIRPANTGASESSIVTAAAANPFPSTLPSVNKGWVTGKVPNNFGIGGTDLGIMWDGGIRLGERFVHVAFGDTFANANMTGDWRSNVLLVSTDHNLTNGLQLLQTGYAGRFIGPFGGRLGIFGSEVTQIPTSGIQIDGKQFVNFMSVKSWDTPGRWTTNYSAISVYDEAKDKWVLAASTIRSAGWFRSTTPYVPGNQNFQQAAYVLQPEDQVGEDGVRYLYAFGTPSGRAGSAYLSRVPEGQVTDLSKYEYWNGKKWVKNKPVAATPIIGDSKKSSGLFGFVVDWANDPNVFGGYLGGLFGAKTGGNVSELSVQYNEYLGKYVVLYGDGNNDIQLRTADTPEGPWSAPVTIATSKQYPGLYAPMIHPWSGTGDLKDSNGDPDLSSLYWNMSLWGDYNVVLMQTDLSPLKAVYV
ncbi:DUF4185 domain-containing protein [Mycobacterium sp. GA-2829]|uniref:DUF4185 domain-containing protein n=1 Tax=Mycobacterium sp. GA-2829 TaxID=1772283 RepID=UPI0007403DEB|nr:DUF4185 domain-containing protein [Mycobacterium sp. GA-2829]KUI28597.1 hypothetical protein AU194_19100 [Mycobacterium sp. GA-2829]